MKVKLKVTDLVPDSDSCLAYLKVARLVHLNVSRWDQYLVMCLVPLKAAMMVEMKVKPKAADLVHQIQKS